MPELDFVMCHECHYTKTKYRATRHNKLGDKKYYQCERCGSFTTPDDGFWKMKNHEEIVSAGIELYYSGISFRETAWVLWRLFGVSVSDVCILLWTRKYSKRVEKFTSMKRPNLSGKWSVDEKFVKVKGKKGYLWLVKDKKRGFVISTVLSDNRKASNAGKLFRKAKKSGNPKSVTHDGYKGYPKKIAKCFPDADDQTSKGFWHKHNNNSTESTNSEFNARYKTMRGFGSFESGNDIIDGWTTHHNFVKRDRKRNKTNAERVGIKKVPDQTP
ncbi:MAG: DDE-type integrase/transposase/recombinase [Candidatus Aenigmarchaeota archaeon]|nr:DDE-type integrase/transposase/recombinase [Candidatus Aenigmarchaeota archaeon]